ncbi:unnamed protein product [Candida parapsilosis]
MTQNGGYDYHNRSTSNSPEMGSTPPTAQSPENNYETHLQAFGQKSLNSSTASIKSTDSSRSIESSSSPKFGSLNRFLSAGNLGRSFDYMSNAPPTRRHWVKDEAVTACGIPSCNKTFNFLRGGTIAENVVVYFARSTHRIPYILIEWHNSPQEEEEHYQKCAIIAYKSITSLYSESLE